MSEPMSPEHLISRKGWISADFDQSRWMAFPPGFPAGYTPESFFSEYASEWWRTSGLKHGEREVRTLARSLTGLHRASYGHLPFHTALVHLPDPRQAPLPVYFGIWPLTGDRDGRLRLLSCADDPAAIRPPEVTEFGTAALGTGLKVATYQLGQDGTTVIAGLNYAWRSEEHETDLRMFTYCPDLARLQGAAADIDDLARATAIVARTG